MLFKTIDVSQQQMKKEILQSVLLVPHQHYHLYDFRDVHVIIITTKLLKITHYIDQYSM